MIVLIVVGLTSDLDSVWNQILSCACASSYDIVCNQLLHLSAPSIFIPNPISLNEPNDSTTLASISYQQCGEEEEVEIIWLNLVAAIAIILAIFRHNVKRRLIGCCQKFFMVIEIVGLTSELDSVWNQILSSACTLSYDIVCEQSLCLFAPSISISDHVSLNETNDSTTLDLVSCQ